MEGKWRYLLILIVAFYSCKGFAQEEQIEAIMDEIVSRQGESVDYEATAEWLFQRLSDPLDINTATEAELSGLLLLSERQALNIVRYRAIYGRFLSLYELQFVPGLTQRDLQLISPLLSISSVSSGTKEVRLGEMVKKSKQVFIYRHELGLESKKGYQADSLGASSYTGSPTRQLLRYRLQYKKNLSAGILLEKDAGEQLIWRPGAQYYGSDHQSLHLAVGDIGRLKKIVIGDYQLSFGQGLAFGGGFSMGKGFSGGSIMRSGQDGLKPYTSSMESGFFRGIASTIELPLNNWSLEVSPFWSLCYKDAAIQYDSSQNELSYTSSSTTGYHRTAIELGNRHNLTEMAWGGHILMLPQNNQFNIGLGLIHSEWNLNKIPSDKLYQRYDFAGKKHTLVNLHTTYSLKNFRWFGEIAKQQQGSMAVIGGMVAYLSHDIQFSTLIRNYPKNFHSFYANAFSEFSGNRNEKGIFWSLNIRPLDHLQVFASYDYFKFPWLRYQVSRPGQCYEGIISAKYGWENSELLGQWRVQEKPRDVAAQLALVLPGVKNNYRICLRQTVSNHFSFKSQLQMSTYTLNQKKSFGYVAAQDVGYQFGSFNLNIRYAVFHTDDYDNRQYLYENDVLYSFSVPAYQGLGTRSYAVLKYKMNRSVQCWLRMARWRFDDRETTGSGLELIDDNKRTDVRFQLSIQF